MCGIVGIVARRNTAVDMGSFHRLMEEAKIRGLHAHGVAYLQNGKVNIYKSAGPYRPAPSQNDISTSAIIGHCRYSTSDLQYNQPIGDAAAAIVHNGIITQEDPVVWKQRFGVECEGRNDSEIILQTVKAGRSPFDAGGSQAAAILTAESVTFWRNEYRPLYYAALQNSVVFASTADILRRALCVEVVSECSPRAIMKYTFQTDELRVANRHILSTTTIADMQHAHV